MIKERSLYYWIKPYTTYHTKESANVHQQCDMEKSINIWIWTAACYMANKYYH